MKKYFYLLAMALCVGFASCSGDDDPGTDLSKEAEKFIGGWSSSGSDDYLFLPDGTFIKGHKGHMWGDDYANWSYDETTKQLATTMDGESWTVSMITESAWTGISAKKGKSITYQRDNSCYLECFFDAMENWDNSDPIAIQTEAIIKTKKESNPFYTYMSKLPNINASNNDIKIESSSIKATNVEFRFADDTLFRGIVTINNYGKENAKMIISGTVVPTNETYNKEFNAEFYIKDGKRIYLNK